MYFENMYRKAELLTPTTVDSNFRLIKKVENHYRNHYRNHHL